MCPDIARAHRNFFGELKFLVAANDNFDAERLRSGLDDFDVLRMTGFGDEENVASILEPVAHRHRSAQAVASSRSEAFAMSSAVRSATIV